ncbi:Glycerophosphoryl diester phosphodiesterase [Entamoeba marina]
MNTCFASFLITSLLLIGLYTTNYYVQPRSFINTSITLNNHPALVAHRGGRGIYPENTIHAMKASLTNHHIDMLETDIHMTKDKEFIFLHDDTLERTTNGQGEVSSYTLEELKQLDFGYKFTNGTSYPYRGKGIQCNTLYEAYEEFKEHNIPMSIEIKNGDFEVVDALIQYLNRMPGCEQFMCFCSANHTLSEYFKQQTNYSLCYEGSETDVILYLLSGVVQLNRLFYYIKPNTNRFFHAPFLSLGGVNFMDPYFRRIHKEIGLEIMYFTINSKKDMATCIGSNCDGITTDLPDDCEDLLHMINGRNKTFNGFVERIVSTDATTTSWDCESVGCEIVDMFTTLIPMKFVLFTCIFIVIYVFLLFFRGVIILLGLMFPNNTKHKIH